MVHVSDEVQEEVDDCLSRLYVLQSIATDWDEDVRKQAAGYFKQGLLSLKGQLLYTCSK